ncbi:MAG: 2-oxo acid dehydrogenase subunit E2 [Planctomycetes bacterium]|nr:2-oxo acid dehydrogenase subunit E2 [Planctomycetota bacterium]
MNAATEPLRYDQGFFNAACALVKEIVPRNHLHFLCELDATGMDAVRAECRRRGSPAPTYTAFVVQAAARALMEHPNLNALIVEGPFRTRLVPLNNVTATVAVERVVGGVDTVFSSRLENAAGRTLADLTEELRHYATAPVEDVPDFVRFLKLIRLARWLPTLAAWILRAPSKSARLWTRFRGGSFAVTSPGKYGGCDQVLPPWPWPLTFSFGAVKRRPFAAGDRVEARKTMRLTITADRRLANGAPLARFAETVRTLLENPAAWADLPAEPKQDRAPAAQAAPPLYSAAAN